MPLTSGARPDATNGLCIIVLSFTLLVVSSAFFAPACRIRDADRPSAVKCFYTRHAGLDPASRGLAGFTYNHYLTGFPDPAPNPIRGEGEMNLVLLLQFLSLVTPGAGLFLTLPNELNELFSLLNQSTNQLFISPFLPSSAPLLLCFLSPRPLKIRTRRD